MSNRVIGWTTDKTVLGMNPSIADRWEAVKSPKCVLYYAFPYRRSDGGRGLGPKLKSLLFHILSRSDVVFITAADCPSMYAAPATRLIPTLLCDLTEAERDKLLSQPCWSFKDLTVFVHPWAPTSDFKFVGLLSGSESPNDTKVLTRDVADATAHMRGLNNRWHTVESIEVRRSIEAGYRAVYVRFASNEVQVQYMAALRTMSFHTVLGTQKIRTLEPCDLCLGVDHFLAHCPFKEHITYNLPLFCNVFGEPKRSCPPRQDGRISKKARKIESSDVVLL